MAQRATRTATGPPPPVSLPVRSLVPNPRNPNIHSEQQILALAAALLLDGQTRPLLARKANKMLIAGHGVHQAALRADMTELQVILLDVDQATADRLMLGDNRLASMSSPNDARMAELLGEINAADWLATGFTKDEGDRLLVELSDADLEVREIATTEVHDLFWIAVRGPLVKQAAVLQRIKVLLAEHADVDIELGTIPDD
jgi:ParB-like chromosome segregation protein Spo0J